MARAGSEEVQGLWELPKGWRWKRLGSLGDWYGGGTPSKREPAFWTGGSIPWVSPKDMKSFIIADTEDHITEAAVEASATKLVPAGSVLCVTRSGILKHSFPVAVTEQEVTLNQDLRGVHPQADIDPLYLGFFLRRSAHAILHECSKDGTTVDSIETSRLLDYPVPLPPTKVDQKRIVSRIKELFTDIEDGERELAETREGVETYRKALLKAAVTGELTADWRRDNPPLETGADLLRRVLAERRSRWEADPKNARKEYIEPPSPTISGLPPLPETWTWASLPQLGDFGRGKSKHRPRNDPCLYGGPFPFVQTGVVADSAGHIERFDQTYSERGLAQSKLWPRGTVCITIAANIAKSGVLGFDACFPDSVVGLSCVAGVNPHYIELFICTAQERLERYAPATAQRNINLETLKEVAIPLPPSEEQDRIVRLVHAPTGLEELLDKERPSTLRQSILAAAFRGDLAA